ncbi:MAG: TetR/AcrR family transcriptional regulator [bacterium]
MTDTEMKTKRPYAPRVPLEQRRSQIIEAALAEYLEHGFEGARVDAIAEAIGVSKPVLYSAFDSKEAIAAAVVEEAHRREAVLNLEADGFAAYSRLGEGEVTPVYEVIFAIATENKDLCRFIYSDYRGAPPEALAVYDQIFAMRTEGIQFYLSQCFAGREDSDEVSSVGAEIVSTVGRRGILAVATGQTEDSKRLASVYGGLVEREFASY